MAQTVVERKLSAIYNTKGLPAFLEACKEVVTTSKFRGEDVSPAERGGVCELVLQRILQTYFKVSGVQGSFYRSVVLKDQTGRGTYTGRYNEIDGVIVSPGYIMAVECKSYRGNMRLIDRGTLTDGKSRTIDLYAQSLSHKSILTAYAKQLALPDRRAGLPVLYIGFLYAESKVRDDRTEAAKREFPIITQSELMALLGRMEKRFAASVFDYQRSCDVFGKCSRSRVLHDKHADYVGYERKGSNEK